MAKFLLATLPFVGHVAPMVPIAQALVERGHDVIWYTSKFYRAKVESTGAQFAPIRSTLDYGDGQYNQHFPARSHYQGLAQIKFDFKHLFIDVIEGYLQDLAEILQGFPADVLLGDPATVSVKILGTWRQIPWVFLNISVLGLPGRDVAPFGLGLLPSYSPLGRLRNWALRWLANQVIFADVQRHYKQLANRLGFEFHPFTPTVSPWLYLQPSVPGFEYIRTDLPPTVHLIGPILPQVEPGFQEPDWWEEMTRSPKPVVLVTQGTLANQPSQLIEPTLQALADEPVQVIVATGGPTAADLAIPVPTNARVVPFVPFTRLMPHVAVYVTNGGYGGVTIALAHGVPVISGGTTEDKAEVGNRITHTGVGINLKTATPSPTQIRDAVREVLSGDRYRVPAQRLQAEFAQFNAVSQAVHLLEQLALTQKPVYAQLPETALAQGWQQIQSRS